MLEKALWLYYTALEPSTPAWAKTTIYGALGYLVLPADAVPDAFPVVGFSDDAGVIASTLAAVATHVMPRAKKRAKEVLDARFGDE